MQAHARVCEEIKWELGEKRWNNWNNFVVTGASLKDHIGRGGRHIKMIFSRMTHHNTKVLVLYYLKYWYMWKLSFGCSHGNEPITCRLAGS